MISLVLAMIGPDRPGLVERVAAAVADHRANWLESRMSNLAGQFAGILRVEAPESQVESLESALAALEEHGLTVVVSRSEATGIPAASPHRLNIVGRDQPGIVRRVASVLAAAQINVEDLDSRLVEAAMSGERLFVADATLRLPSGADLDAVQRRLEDLSADLMVDIRLSTDGDE